MKQSCIYLLFLFFISNASAGSVTRYGVFDDTGKHLETSDQIKHGRKISLGFCFSLKVDTDETKLTLVETVVHPLVTKSNGIESIGHSVPRKYPVHNRKVEGCAIYHAERAKDLVSGEWNFSISQNGIDLVNKKFRVY